MDTEKAFKRFVEERRYFKNVTYKTRVWYDNSWNAFKSYIEGVHDEKTLRTKLKEAVMAMMKRRKLSPTSINNYIRCMNAFTKWLLDEGEIKTSIKMEKLKEKQKVREILTDEHVARLINYRPKRTNDRRVHTMVMVILDCGLRLDEVRKLKRIDLDFDNFLMKIFSGKGRKQRVVPISAELRKILFKYVSTMDVKDNGFLFATRSGRLVSARNVTRDLHRLGQDAGIPKIGFHRLRHTMATGYLKAGGNVVSLRRILGHSSINTTMIYEHIQTEDLVEKQQTLSLLSAKVA